MGKKMIPLTPYDDFKDDTSKAKIKIKIKEENKNKKQNQERGENKQTNKQKNEISYLNPPAPFNPPPSHLDRKGIRIS